MPVQFTSEAIIRTPFDKYSEIIELAFKYPMGQRISKKEELQNKLTIMNENGTHKMYNM